jgi:hypothetical protein
MAKVANVNILVASVTSTGAADMLYYLKTTLVSAGWTVLSSGTGTGGTYNSSGDSISSATVMNNANAWYRITDPASVREYVMQRGAATTAVIKYSRQTKFTAGSPSATVLPTTGSGDGVIVVGGGTDASPTAAAFVTSSTTARLHVVTNNAPTNGVYPWYLYIVATGGTTLLGFYSHEAIASGSCSPSDSDPSYFCCCSSLTAFKDFASPSLFASNSGIPVGNIRCWYKYGLAGSNFDGNAGAGGGLFLTYGNWNVSNNNYTARMPGVRGTNPYDNKDNAVPAGVISYSAVNTTSAFKGFSTGIKLAMVLRDYPELLDKGTEDAYVYFPAITAGSQPSLLVPWTSEDVDPSTSA